MKKYVVFIIIIILLNYISCSEGEKIRKYTEETVDTKTQLNEIGKIYL